MRQQSFAPSRALPSNTTRAHDCTAAQALNPSPSLIAVHLLLRMFPRNASSFSTNRVVGLRFHSRDDILVCVDSSNGFRLLDVQQRRLAACHDGVEFPQVPSGKGVWGGEGDVHPLSGIAFNPEDPLHSMLLFNHRLLVIVCRGYGLFEGCFDFVFVLCKKEMGARVVAEWMGWLLWQPVLTFAAEWMGMVSLATRCKALVGIQVTAVPCGFFRRDSCCA